MNALNVHSLSSTVALLVVGREELGCWGSLRLTLHTETSAIALCIICIALNKFSKADVWVLQEEGKSVLQCVKEAKECGGLRYAYFACKRGQLDARNRITGNKGYWRTAALSIRIGPQMSCRTKPGFHPWSNMMQNFCIHSSNTQLRSLKSFSRVQNAPRSVEMSKVVLKLIWTLTPILYPTSWLANWRVCE